MKPLLVACGIHNFIHIMVVSKTYTCSDSARKMIKDCLIVTVQKILVLQFPPLLRRSISSLVLLINYLNYLELPPPDLRVGE